MDFNLISWVKMFRAWIRWEDLRVVPLPVLHPRGVRLRTVALPVVLLITADTKKMLIDLPQKSMLSKAQARPDLVKKVLQKGEDERPLALIEEPFD